jgi:hypothetical protein
MGKGRKNTQNTQHNKALVEQKTVFESWVAGVELFASYT